MIVESMKIRNFRNIKAMDFVPCGKSNIIFGDNAQGKTNLLEAIWLFSGAKSFRGSKESEFIRFNEQSAKLELNYFREERSQNASLEYFKDSKKVFINEIKQEGTSKLSGRFCAVVFSPDHLSLVKQGPDKRRKFIDISLCQAYPKYIKILDGYRRILNQRNTLLKDMEAHPSLEGTLEVWDQSLLDYGAYIISMRARYISKLGKLAGEVYEGISSGKENFSVDYVPGFKSEEIDGRNREDIRKKMESALIKSRKDDIRQRVTGIGPHRDDVEITADGKSARLFGSQGQQRSCVLALKLAECGILEERNAEPPVILLDDVMSELDQSRRDFLLNRLSGKQTFITCCESELFSKFKDGMIFKIKGGSMEKE